MGETRRRRRRKHRGTPAGTIERKRGVPATRREARELAAKRRAERLARPPTWRQAAVRAAIAAALVCVIFVVLGRPLANALALAVFLFLLYLPLGYLTDQALWRWRQRRLAAARSGAGGSARGGTKKRKG